MKQFKKANLKLADPGLSNYSRKLKEQNELILRELRKMKWDLFELRK